MEHLPLLIVIPFLALAGYFVFKLIRRGGIKAALFGAQIEATVGEVQPQGSRFMRVTLKVHRLKSDDRNKAVALELTTKPFLSYQMMPVTLSGGQAQTLAALLEQAIAEVA